MSKKEIKMLVDKIYNSYTDKRADKKGVTKKNINLLLDCWKKCDYSPMFTTKLYNNHGGNYCYLLEVIHAHTRGVNL